MGMSVIDKENASINAQVKSEQQRVKENLRKINERMDKGPQLMVRFMNLEDPPGGENPTPLVRFFYNGRKFEVKHDDVVTWPQEVVEHINSLFKPVYGNRTDPVTGAVESVQVSKEYRFQCIPTNLAASATPGRDKKNAA